MSRKIKTWRDPYDEGFSTTKLKEIEFEPGLTVLVGCNGAGKTTLLHNIKEVLLKENIPTYSYDNTKDNVTNKFDSFALKGDFSIISSSLCSSEGENINISLNKLAPKLKKFIDIGWSPEDDRKQRAANLYGETYKFENASKERWILLDAIDSGFSIDNVINLKGFFNLLILEAERQGFTLYIIVSANEYELANGENCFDVLEGKYITFENYESFKKFILKTSDKKFKRNQRSEETAEERKRKREEKRNKWEIKRKE